MNLTFSHVSESYPIFLFRAPGIYFVWLVQADFLLLFLLVLMHLPPPGQKVPLLYWPKHLRSGSSVDPKSANRKSIWHDLEPDDSDEDEPMTNG